MATIGSLVADLSANSAAFAADMGKAQRALKSGSARMNRTLAGLDRGFAKVGRSVGRTLKGMVGFRAIVGTVAGTAGLGLLVKRSIDTADAIGKIAKAVGVGSDALQEYRFAAEQSNVSTELFDNSMIALVKRVGEAKAGVGPLVSGLKGLDQELLANIKSARNQEQAFELIIRAMADAETAADRARIANAAFSRSGVVMVNLVEDGAEGFEALRRQAREAGLVIRGDLVSGAETASDKLNLLARSISTRVTSAVLELTPQISALADKFSQGLPTLIRWVERFGEFVGLLERGPADEIARLTEKIGELQQRTETGILGFKFENKFVNQQIAALERQLELQRELIRGRALTGLPAPGLTAAPAAVPAAAARIADIGAPVPGKKPLEQLTVMAARLKTVEERAKAVFESTRTPQEQFAQRMVMLNDLVERGAIAQDTYGRAVKQAQEELGGAVKVTERLNQAAGELAIDAIQGQIRGWRDLADIAVRALNSILQKQLQLNAASQGGGGGGGGGGFLGFLGGLVGINASGAGGGLGPQFSGTGSQGLASSGSFARGGSFLVGGSGGTDSQRVSFLASPNERVTVTRPDQAPPGGPAIQIGSIDLRGADVAAVARLERALKELNASIEGRALRVVEGRVLEGGDFRAAFPQ